jgi:hypothetical protein
MANVLNEEKKQQVLALGRLGWPLRQIQKATRIRRETASQYLKAVGIAVRPPGGWGRRAAKPANEAIPNSEVITDLNPFSGRCQTFAVVAQCVRNVHESALLLTRMGLVRALVLYRHGIGVYSFLSRHSFKPCQYSPVFILVTLHRKAALLVAIGPGQTDIVLL